MKKLLYIALASAIVTCSCYVAGRRYSYVNHRVYVYKMINDSTVAFMDKHDYKYVCSVDSVWRDSIGSKKKGWYVLRKYDTGETVFLGEY